MSERRPTRDPDGALPSAHFEPDEYYFLSSDESNDSGSDEEENNISTEAPHTEKSATLSAVLHPSLTDFGPRSATRYFRLRYPSSVLHRHPVQIFSSINEKIPRVKPRPGFQRSLHNDVSGKKPMEETPDTKIQEPPRKKPRGRDQPEDLLPRVQQDTMVVRRSRRLVKQARGNDCNAMPVANDQEGFLGARPGEGRLGEDDDAVMMDVSAGTKSECLDASKRRMPTSTSTNALRESLPDETTSSVSTSTQRSGSNSPKFTIELPLDVSHTSSFGEVNTGKHSENLAAPIRQLLPNDQTSSDQASSATSSTSQISAGQIRSAQSSNIQSPSFHPSAAQPLGSQSSITHPSPPRLLTSASATSIVDLAQNSTHASAAQSSINCRRLPQAPPIPSSSLLFAQFDYKNLLEGLPIFKTKVPTPARKTSTKDVDMSSSPDSSHSRDKQKGKQPVPTANGRKHTNDNKGKQPVPASNGMKRVSDNKENKQPVDAAKGKQRAEDKEEDKESVSAVKGKKRLEGKGNDEQSAQAESGTARTRFKQWDLQPLSFHIRDPLPCPLSKDNKGWPISLPQDLFRDVAQYLSFNDVKNLRLANRQFAAQLSDLRFQSVVVPFNHELFGVESQDFKDIQAVGQDTIVGKYASKFGKFGISHELDLNGLIHSTAKPSTEQHSAWWGSFLWPATQYPRFQDLKQLEDLADAPGLLRSVMARLTEATELGLSIDSGHGWLNGADLSDLAVWDMRRRKSEVFGQNFPAEDIWDKYGREQIILAGQRNTIDHILGKPFVGGLKRAMFANVPVRPLESYRCQSMQPDLDQEQHTGGTLSVFRLATATAANPPVQPGLLPPPGQNFAIPLPPASAGPCPRLARKPYSHLEMPQYPIIYNGYNVAGEYGGHALSVHRYLAEPSEYPIKPGELTEAQAQWLLETLWAQKAFISCYVTSVIHNRTALHQVHSLHIGKISSGLLGSLSHTEFWKALPQLHTITILVIPDWRRAHEPGDGAFNEHMPISPTLASNNFARLLRKHIAPLENVSNLKIGFIGGGENAKGLLARGQHILPAPITLNPKAWLTIKDATPEVHTMLSFDHVQKLTFVNCWFSPKMLRTFMNISKDSSLKHLTLESVSMTVPQGHSRSSSFLNRFSDKIEPRFQPQNWLREIMPHMPVPLVWTRVIDFITPGRTIRDYLLAAHFIPPTPCDSTTSSSRNTPQPDSFRGNIQKLTLKSCGYVHISGLTQTEFNQNNLVMPINSPTDPGLLNRKSLLQAPGHSIKTADPQGHEYPLLGKMTQCVHPVEKIVLERAWGMKFGWENDLSRWASVEDGLFEGGTGRFSGTVSKTDGLRDCELDAAGEDGGDDVGGEGDDEAE